MASPGQVPVTPRAHGNAQKPLSALEIGGDLLVQLLRREPSADDLAVDEEGGRGIDSELRVCTLTGFLEGRKHLLIRETFLEALLGEARLFRDSEHRFQRLLHYPFLLLREKCFNQWEVLVL